MTSRQWYLGMAVAAAALIPLSANAVTTPNLRDGFTGEISIKFVGTTTEFGDKDFLGSGDDGGSCTAGVCSETTWGAGLLTTVDEFGTANALWSAGDDGLDIAFMIYGIADKSVLDVFGDSSLFLIKNRGANDTTQWPDADGKIHIDLYSVPQGSVCFSGAGCLEAGDRTDWDSITGLTTIGTLIASIELVPGILGGTSNSDVTMRQLVDSETLPASGTGDFYADCLSGPVCDDQLGKDGYPTAQSTTADLLGGFHIQGPTTGLSDNDWNSVINDPVNALAINVPEPASLALLGSALAFLGVAVRRRRNGMSA